VLFKLDQASCDIRAPQMPGKDADQVVSLSGAHADCPHGAGGAPIERGAHLRLHDRQASAQSRGGVRVVLMPSSPVHSVRETTTVATLLPTRLSAA
jgi:hypothetical protein